MDRTTRITIASGGMTQEVELESYVAGVVTHELTGPIHPQLAKAQAVAARSYAMYTIQYPRHANAAVCDTPHCQRYAPVIENYPQVLAAIAETAGEVLVADGVLANALYSAYCAGATRSADEAGWGAVSYLVSVPCQCRQWRADPKRQGHGVGMCQRGAQKLARDGWNYKDILAHYYVGAGVEVRSGNPLDEAIESGRIALPNWEESALSKTMRRYGLIPISHEYPWSDGSVRRVGQDVHGVQYVLEWKSGWGDDAQLLYPHELINPTSEMVVPSRSRVLPLAIQSQFDVFHDSNLAPGDCGFACLQSVGAFRGIYKTIDEWVNVAIKSTSLEAGFWAATYDQLITTARIFGIEAKRVTISRMNDLRYQIADRGQPVILLVRGDGLIRSSHRGNWSHWIVVSGVDEDRVFILDSYEPRNGAGIHQPYTFAEIMNASERAAIDGNRPYGAIIFT